ncbi:type III secretion protein V [Sphingomonas guangdongensis]|uniref:Type III secretion protein V n=1 Tax=Sphingomonas guangdongensis TaxID=1141890 RepID=A0A285QX93_9SPHN|nr:flagellar biosynthesis protein FlhA [Sphingomonas guangdongensis]SOB86446.1 type III secretion protein V [Sphingomonas guangdongensis]
MQLAAKRFAGRVRVADALLIGVLASVVALFILPIPPLLLDLLIAINMTLGLLLLLSVLYVAKPLDFSTFPSVLLLTTLFRLGISVATTKMILLTANGGHIVAQFGEMVAGGNLVVGLVVFLIITVVQFIVVAKGAERVAEVAARFSLDAMPGKQLSIDSDLRSGLLTKDEAREKRRAVENESRLYGSLDGAMKFVKGDAIAALVIVVINLLGGIAVGMFWHNMPMGEAVSTFSVLTIGDGLVAQIPAFFCALAAGLLVTRTTDEETEKELAPAIQRQLSGKPHVLLIAGALAGALALVPGFPVAVFLLIGTALVGAGAWAHPAAGAYLRGRLGIAEETPGSPDDVAVHAGTLVLTDPLQLRVAEGRDPASLAALTASIQARLAALQDGSGITVPPLRVLVDRSGTLPPGGWALIAFDAPLGSGVLPASDDARLVALTAELLRRNLSMFLGLQEVTDLLNWLGDRYPEVVKEAVRAVPTATIADVLRLLAEEQVPLRNLRDAVEAIAAAGQMERDPRAIAERVRVALRRNIVAPLTVEGRLKVVMIGSVVEEALRDTVTAIDGQSRLAIAPYQMRALIDLLRRETEASGARAILTAQDLRRALRLVTAADMFDVPVLSFNELNPAVPLDVVAELNHAPDLLGFTPQTEAAE